MQNGFLKWARKYHKWPALIISLFLVMFSLSGIVMNHRGLFSKIDLNRKYLPSSYKLENWNMGAVRSAEKLNDGSILVYGNSGIWKTDSTWSSFSDFNNGFPEGMDMRKVRIVRQSPSGILLAGTYFGLFEYSLEQGNWQKISLPVREERIQDIICNGNRIIVVSRSELFVFNDGGVSGNPSKIKLREPEDYDRKMRLFMFIWITHSGEIAGIAGKLVLDFLALLIIFLVSTGLIVFFIPKIAKRMKGAAGSLPEARRKNLRLHNRGGAWFFVLLVLVPFTGMFLRPPFLIPIAYARIPVVPLAIAGKDNPWEDKLRAIAWDEGSRRYIISASDGFYSCDSTFTGAPVRFSIEPPVSVMGINVFEPSGDGSFLVGSFNGLWHWDPVTGSVSAAFHNRPAEDGGRSRGRPAEALVSGMIRMNGCTVVFDYDKGALTGEGSTFPPMPEIIMEKSPMPLWNVAQEIHTGRIYQPILGPFYILVVPLTGLLTILVFVTGYIRWEKVYKKK